jgi:hypothetical protein
MAKINPATFHEVQPSQLSLFTLPNRCAVCHLRTNSTIGNLHKNLSDRISNQRQWNEISRLEQIPEI